MAPPPALPATATGRFYTQATACEMVAKENKAAHRTVRAAMARVLRGLDGFERLAAHKRWALVVDDDVLFGPAIKRSLERMGYAVHVVTNAADAHAFVAEHPELALVMVDQVLSPLVSGLEVAEEMRRTTTSRVVMMSGYPEIASRLRVASQRVAAAFLYKPFTDEELALALG